ncbi:type II CRISPR-associated endonuclease Cas1 [Candidatus Saccharibacteria bacterium]|nr:type II CRISPR-associated endonuclease Cas1 [Candidatus Saccharibacteria bacterium]
MAWRVIGISNPARLRVKDNQLVIAQDESVNLPIEDIDALVLDSYGITLTANLITELSASGTTVVICDDKHLPSSVILPYSQHSRQAKVSRNHLAMNQPLKKQIWKEVVSRKIVNQASVLDKFDFNPAPLVKLANEVKSGDTDNRESIAARIYFADLFDDATRRKPTWYNAALNYGYAIVRSHIARHIAARGLIASQGVFHRSELNSFNLADDIIEPYRAIVDDYILTFVAPLHMGDKDSVLTKEDRMRILDIINFCVIMENRKVPVRFAVERTVESFVQVINSKEVSDLKLPLVNQK